MPALAFFCWFWNQRTVRNRFDSRITISWQTCYWLESWTQNGKVILTGLAGSAFCYNLVFQSDLLRFCNIGVLPIGPLLLGCCLGGFSSVQFQFQFSGFYCWLWFCSRLFRPVQPALRATALQGPGFPVRKSLPSAFIVFGIGFSKGNFRDNTTTPICPMCAGELRSQKSFVPSFAFCTG